MNFRKVNNLTGWVVFAIATLTYSLTREARGSLWDCGEFVATAYKLQMAHPPGAPMFSLLGRLFILFFGDKPQTAANAVNFMSALVSAATILFLFWTITHFARKMFVRSGEALTGQQIFTVMAAGAVGALAYTFTDSFWYSAVEGEVYALSSFFTGLVFWAMLKWEHADELAGTDENARARSDRWIVFLFFMMGLSIGVHLLNLLTIPAIVMIYYYRRYTPSVKGAIGAFLIGCIITGIIQVAIIQYSMKAAGLFDIMFVNSFGMPFFSGFTVYFLLIALLVIVGLRFKTGVSKTVIIVWTTAFFLLAFLPFAFGSTLAALKIILLLIVGAVLGYFIRPTALKIIKLFLWCFAFMMLGYFMYFTNIIRSSANPAIDMNNVDNPINLVYYLSREQYGTQPLFYGAHYAAQVPEDINQEDPYVLGEETYVKGSDKYIPIGRKREYNYNGNVKQLFVRVWDSSNDQQHADFYADWLGLAKPDPNTGQGSYGAPSYADNINWFMSYQTSFMYLRYFMWNFSGKQNDLQGYGNKRDGNWISGISLMDNARLGDQNQMPESIKHNKAHNVFFMLPFVLGIIGFVYQFLKNRKDWVVTFLLFFFTGMAIVLYLNQPGNQPRERDYAYVGSFYAFAVWIGLSVVALLRSALEKEDKEAFQKLLVYGASGTFLITALSTIVNTTFSGIIIAGLTAAVIYAAVLYIVTFAARALSSGGSNIRPANILVTLLCLAVPGLMAQQEWNDHDRSEKTMAPDLAKDYLESCAPNAILFTFGDNDTYPLWYAQEVENVRPDIRIINTSLLGIDWYINQLRYKINDADSVDVILSPEQIEGHNREYLRFAAPQPGQNIDVNNFYPLYDVIKTFIGARAEDPDTKRDVGSTNLPFRKFFVPVNKDLVRKNGTANPADSVMDQIAIEIPPSRGGIQRNDLMILSIIASNQWNRPIYFTAPYGELGFGQYLRKDGLTYRLVPFNVKTPQANWVVDQAYRQMRAGGTSIRDNNQDVMAKNLLTKFEFGGANKKGVYFDEVNRQYLLNIRSIFAEAAGNLADAGKKEEAVKLLDKAEAGILPENLPYAMTSRYNQHNQTGLMYAEAYYKAGKLDMARKVIAAVKKDVADQRKYYNYLKTDKPEYYQGMANIEEPLNEITEAAAEAIEAHYDPLKKGEKSPVQELPAGDAAKAADSSGKNPDTSKK
ncbi:DUF2723 domain-containing protein [Niabella beijingensis]|uniref:glycosyltransferase family 117 protein n=1 Tax=Niabella beijingensis TaxID=2872700 RepID=UPI001CBB3539|nr:DUF2723 domain-containing protein [Niabella beijingensis]MBZ4190956.1 DUF2723 domain-containing protein [Niabella beijingensis]